MKKTITLLFCLSIGFLSQAQTDSVAPPPPPPPVNDESTDMFEYDKHSVGLYIGAKGIGLEYGYALNERWSIRAAVGGLYWTPIEFSQNFQGEDYGIEITPEYLLVDIGAEFYPWAGKSFKIFGALGYAFYQNVAATWQYQGTIEIGEMGSVSDGEVGELFFTGETNKLVPSAGIGWGHTVPKKKVGLYAEIGTYYMGAPKIEIEATNWLQNTSLEEQTLNDGFEPYQWLPFVNVGLRIKL